MADALAAWFEANARPLPWRRSYRPYEVWVSEIMLQQTQMERGVEAFTRWMERFPDPEALARAGEDEVLKMWEGLGYYNRARNLHRAAGMVVERHGGEVPADPAALRALPGVGPYTAAAVASIAHGRDVPLVDANVGRLFSRLFDIDQPLHLSATKRALDGLAADLLPPGRARMHNQALMELGALVCTPKSPRCSACPLDTRCRAKYLDLVFERPVPAKAAEYIPMDVASGLLIHDGGILVQKRPPAGVWAGLWEFPGGAVEEGETPDQAVVREFLEETELEVAVAAPLPRVRHGYTRYRVTLHPFLLTLAGRPRQPALHAAQESRWAGAEELAGLAFPAGHRKLLDKLAASGRLDRLLAGGAIEEEPS
nr:A/G-specific adenine glycosylase [Desulfohalovibrio reitneri]